MKSGANGRRHRLAADRPTDGPTSRTNVAALGGGSRKKQLGKRIAVERREKEEPRQGKTPWEGRVASRLPGAERVCVCAPYLGGNVEN